MATPFEQGISVLQNMGFYTVVFPFLMIAAVTYGILNKIEVFGDTQAAKNVNALLAVVMAMVVVSFAPASKFLITFIPYLSGLILMILILLIVFKFLGADDTEIKGVLKHPASFWVIILVVLAMLGLVIQEAFPVIPVSDIHANQTSVPLLQQAALISDPTFMGLIIMFIIFALATYMITKSPSEGSSGGSSGGD